MRLSFLAFAHFCNYYNSKEKLIKYKKEKLIKYKKSDFILFLISMYTNCIKINAS